MPKLKEESRDHEPYCVTNNRNYFDAQDTYWATKYLTDPVAIFSVKLYGSGKKRVVYRCLLIGISGTRSAAADCIQLNDLFWHIHSPGWTNDVHGRFAFRLDAFR